MTYFNNEDSHFRNYAIGKDGRPLNPKGRTGLRGHGVLGKCGPNHAADCIVSRFHNGQLQFIAIQRRDTGEWAVPGGMVDSGESALQAAQRFGYLLFLLLLCSGFTEKSRQTVC